MWQFLIPLVLGFTLTTASVFTTFFTRQFGELGGMLASIILRVMLGIPVWAIGYIMAVSADAVMLFEPMLITTALAWLLTLAGIAVAVAGLLAIGGRAAAPSIRDALVEQGIYARIRHPLYSGVLLGLAGLFLFRPILPVLIACVLGVIWITLVHVPLEEIDLVQRLPDYKGYMQRVPRFIPRVRLRKLK